MACIRKRRGRWVIDFYDQHGKRRWKTLKNGTTKKDARVELRAVEDMVAGGIYLPAKKVPLFSEVAQDWLAHKKPNLRTNTWEEYGRQIKNSFPELDNLKICRINIATVEEFITKRQNQGMNLNTLRRILVSLNQIMNYAVRHGYIDHNPLNEAERPRRHGNEAEPQGKISVLKTDQINALLSGVSASIEKQYENKKPLKEETFNRKRLKEQKYKTLFLLAMFSGARQGELLGLKWSDVEWENGQIHIQRTFNHGRFFLPKSKASDRRIDLGPTVLTELKKWKLACPKNELDLAFPSEAGTPIDHHHMVQRYFKPALKSAGLPNIRFHDLRHTYASLLIEQGENIKYIQSQLGHSSPSVTLNVYAHLMKPTNQEAACRLEKTIFGNDSSKMVAK